jgi:chorismate mutase/prephenate dehydrogenase
MPAGTPSIEKLRREIERTDREILRAIERRLARATAIGRRKSEAGEPIRNFAVESKVIARWRKGLARSGVPPGRAEAFARWLIEEALRVQPDPRRPVRRVLGSSLRVSVIGGAGAMGEWLAGFFEDFGHRVAVVDPRASRTERPTHPDVETAVGASDVVAFATPIRETAPLLRRATDTGTNALLFDVLSVKAPIVPALRDAVRRGRRVTSAHPMFGPSARSLSGRNLLIVSCGVPEADREARALFAPSALSISQVPLDRHDRLIAESLGLSHAVNLLFLAALSREPVRPGELSPAASTTFHRQSAVARAVASEGPELYLDIQSLNPHSGAVYRAMREGLDRLESIIERHDATAFRRILACGRRKLDPGPEPMRA